MNESSLIRLTKRARVNRAVAFRARLVLACADAPDSAVVRRLRTTTTTVAKWRLRFIAGRLRGVVRRTTRRCTAELVSDEAVEAVIVKTLETTPNGETHWSTRRMAKAAGMSHTMVGRIWRTFGLQPHLTESFKLSPDPQLVAKVRDVVGLYMHPPHNAVRVRGRREIADPGAPTRATDPADGHRPPGTTDHNYLRHGTVDLFAALNVATGEVIARCKPQHRAQDFVAFLRDIDAAVEAGTRCMWCWTICRPIRRRRSIDGCCGILVSSFTSRRPTRHG